MECNVEGAFYVVRESGFTYYHLLGFKFGVYIRDSISDNKGV
jgi:hypothetical protein